MFEHLTRAEAVTAVPTSSERDIQNDLRKLVYAHRDPPTTEPSELEQLKEQEIDGADGATHYDSATAGWEPEPRYNAFQDNIDNSRLIAELETISKFITDAASETEGVQFIGYIPPAAARKYINTTSNELGSADTIIMGTVTDIYPTPTPDSGPTALQLEGVRTGLPDPTTAAIDDSARPEEVPSEPGWLSLSLLGAAWCPVPAPDGSALYIQPSNDIALTRGESNNPAVRLRSPEPARRTMMFEADVDDAARGTMEELDDNRVPIPAVIKNEGTWYVSEEHLAETISTLLEEGHGVSVTPVIEARDLPTEFRAPDAPPLPWHTVDSTG